MRKKILILVMVIYLPFNMFSLESPAMLAAVINEAITSLTKLYEMYDQTMNQIQMIKQKYEQMQFYIDRAANFKWDEIKWDGNLDFRNEIMQATSQVNKQLTNIRKIKNSITSDTITLGGQSFSIASLAGIKMEGQGDLKEFVQNGFEYYGNGIEAACKVWAEGVSDEEAQYIWAKYGLSPANYKMVREVENKLGEITMELIGNVEESPEKKEIEEQQSRVVENIMDMLSQEGATPDEIASVNAMLQEQTIFSLRDLGHKIDSAAGYLAWNNQLQAQKEEAQNASIAEMSYEMTRNSISDNF